MATIKIKRTSEWVNKVRNYKIFIDEHFVGEIADGATLEFPTSSGKHTVTAKIGWSSSPDIFIDIETDEIKHFTVQYLGGLKYYISWLMFWVFGSMVFSNFLSKKGLGYATSLSISIFLFLVFYIAFRKKFLTLNETSEDGIQINKKKL